MLMGNIFVTIATIYIFRLQRTRINYLDIPLFIFLWTFTATLYTFVLGLAHLLEPNRIAIISLIGTIILAYPYRKKCRQLPQRLGAFLYSLRRFRPAPFDALLLFLILIELARIAFHVWYISPYVWDTMTYHLPNVAEWVQKGRIYTITAATTRTNWPMTFEVFETWFAVFLHHDILIQLAGVWFSILAFSSVYAIARTLNFSNRLSLFAALLYIYTPVVSVRATSCDTDIPVAGVFLLCVAFVLELLRRGTREKLQPGNFLLIMVMAFCYGIGAKAFMAFIVPGLALLLIVALIKQHLVRKFLRLFLPGRISSYPRFFTAILLIMASGLLGGYWYIRNWVIFDNPFYPVDFSIFGHLIFGTGKSKELFGPTQQGHASLSVMWLNLRAFLTDKIFDHHGQMNTNISEMSGWGWFSFACGLPALVYALLCVKGFRLLSAAFFISFLSLLACVDPDPWYMRFALWFPALFALSFVAFLRSFNSKLLRIPIIALALFCTLLNFIAMLNVGLFDIPDFQKVMSMPALERSVANLTHHASGVHREALAHIPKGETIAYWVSNNDWTYPLYDSDFSRRLIYVPMKDMEFIATMREQNLKYLFVYTFRQNELAQKNELVQKAIQDNDLEKITDFLYTLK